MIKQIFNISIFSIGLVIILNSCGLQKETVSRLDRLPKEFIILPLDYCNLYPDTTSIEQWETDYNYYEKFLTRDILKNQMGQSYNKNGVQTWWCAPSARTYIQLDTNTMILNKEKVIGEWKVVSNRKITYEDSISYGDKLYVFKTI